MACHARWGWPASLWYGLSLPVASLGAFYYAREIRRLGYSLRTLGILFRAPFATRHLVRRRAELEAEIELIHKQLRRDANESATKA